MYKLDCRECKCVERHFLGRYGQSTDSDFWKRKTISLIEEIIHIMELKLIIFYFTVFFKLFNNFLSKVVGKVMFKFKLVVKV